MRIYDMFADDINRKINGVIQVEQSDDDVIEQELHEYVITNELKKHFMSFFSYYSDAFDTPTADTGVWISGFFGSGKSHFLKMLSYILENREVKGVRTVERFREKFADDPATFMMIDKSTRSQTEAILFNIDVESSINKDKTAVLRVFATVYTGKDTLKDELTYRFYASHPFLYKGDVLLFLHKGYNIADFDALVSEFHLKVAISDPIGALFDLPALYRPAREALDLMTETSFHSGSVFQVSQLKPLLLLSSLQTRSDLVSERIRFLSVCDREKGSQYCETLYHYLSSGRSLKETCAALFTHRNTILYRIHKMRDEYGVPLDDPSAHLELLLGVSLALFRTKGADFFLKKA